MAKARLNWHGKYRLDLERTDVTTGCMHERKQPSIKDSKEGFVFFEKRSAKAAAHNQLRRTCDAAKRIGRRAEPGR